MLVKKTTIVDTLLNGATEQVIIIPTFTVGTGIFKKSRKSKSIIIDNKSGAEIEYGIFSKTELSAYTADSSVSDLIPLPDTIMLSIEKSKSTLSAIIIKGTSGHTASLNIYAIMEE